MNIIKRLKSPNITPRLLCIPKYDMSSMGKQGLISNKGGCHCGKIRYDYKTTNHFNQWNFRECQCTFCRKHNSCNVSDNEGEIELFINNEMDLIKYEFGLKTCQFLMCSTCGTYCAAATNDEKKATINVNTLDNRSEVIQASRQQHKENRSKSTQKMNFDSETMEERNNRRANAWTPIHKIQIGNRTIVNRMEKMW